MQPDRMSQISTNLSAMLIGAVLLSGCVDQAVFDAVPKTSAATKSGEIWPSLSPVSRFDARIGQNQTARIETTQEAEALQARADRLRARARRLRSDVLTSQERRKLNAAIADI